MSFPLRISRSGLELIKSFEGYRERAARLPDGRWTVGYGHVRSAREGVRVSPEDAEALLIYDVKRVESALGEWLLTPLSQNEFDALVSFVFNISPGQFRDSEVLRLLNNGDHIGAANALDAWRKARVNGALMVVDALVRRRAAEKALFLEHPDGRPAAPTPIVTPQLDQSMSAPMRLGEPSPENNGRHAVTGGLRAEADAQSMSDDASSIRNMTEAIAAMADADHKGAEHKEDASGSRAEGASSASQARLRGRAKTPAEAAEEVGVRLSRILEREEAAVKPEAKSDVAAAARTAGKATASVGVMDKAVEDRLVEAIARLQDKEPKEERSDLQPTSGQTRRKETDRDAWSLSEALKDEGPASAFAPTLDGGLDDDAAENNGRIVIDDTETAHLPNGDVLTLDRADIAEETSAYGWLWWCLSFVAAAMVVMGAVNFYQVAHRAENVSRSDIAVGPLMVGLGVILLLMGVYFLMTRASRTVSHDETV